MPYVLVKVDDDADLAFSSSVVIEPFDNLVEAWDVAQRLNASGHRAFVAAVLAAPEFHAAIASKKSGVV